MSENSQASVFYGVTVAGLLDRIAWKLETFQNNYFSRNLWTPASEIFKQLNKNF